MNRIMIAGTNSNVGKTTITIGILAALKRRGQKVAPYKVGPDYIDPGFHKFVTGSPSYNLDSYLLDERYVKYLLNTGENEDKTIGVVEGVMGLYDGFGVKSAVGSSAHVAKITKTPVILVMDGSGISNSAAAVALGYSKFDENVDIKGVILNKVSGAGHYKLIKEIIETNTELKCVGYMPKNCEVSIDSRHLGLIPAVEIRHLKEKIDELAQLVEETIDIDELIKISAEAPPVASNTSVIDKFIDEHANQFHGKRIGVAWDKAFSFYYQSNLDILKELGARIIEFSPMTDKSLPKGLNSIYLGGGFPEVFGRQLCKNREFRRSIRDYLESSGKCYGECGGFMYLGKSIEDRCEVTSEMVGFFPFKFQMTDRLQRFGYVEMSIEVDGIEYTSRAHEFHYSKMITDGEDVDFKYRVKKYRDDRVLREWKCGLQKKNTIAGYPHFYFLSNLELMTKLL